MKARGSTNLRIHNLVLQLENLQLDLGKSSLGLKYKKSEIKVEQEKNEAAVK